MAVRHGITDMDKHFIIDPVTRTIINESGKFTLIQYDHNSERFTFECPRYVDDHDMSLCDRVEIHYINTGLGDTKNTGVYEVHDLEVSYDDSNVVVFSWLISKNATEYVGKLNFVIRFACTAEDSTIEYAWNTGIYSDIIISKGIYNGEEYVREYIDVLEAWRQDLYALGVKITSVEQTVTSTEDDGINVVTMTMSDGSTESFQVKNGSKGDMGIYIASINKISGDGSSGSIDTYSINMSNGSNYTFRVYNGANGRDGVNGIDGRDGRDGINGRDGVSITSITRTSGNGSAGTIDTYTVTMTDGTKSTFQVYNGANGKDGSNGSDGKDGSNGTDGKSAYDYALDGGYEGSEEDFSKDLASISDIENVVNSLIDVKLGVIENGSY